VGGNSGKTNHQIAATPAPARSTPASAATPSHFSNRLMRTFDPVPPRGVGNYTQSPGAAPTALAAHRPTLHKPFIPKDFSKD